MPSRILRQVFTKAGSTPHESSSLGRFAESLSRWSGALQQHLPVTATWRSRWPGPPCAFPSPRRSPVGRQQPSEAPLPPAEAAAEKWIVETGSEVCVVKAQIHAGVAAKAAASARIGDVDQPGALRHLGRRARVLLSIGGRAGTRHRAGLEGRRAGATRPGGRQGRPPWGHGTRERAVPGAG